MYCLCSAVLFCFFYTRVNLARKEEKVWGGSLIDVGNEGGRFVRKRSRFQTAILIPYIFLEQRIFLLHLICQMYLTYCFCFYIDLSFISSKSIKLSSLMLIIRNCFLPIQGALICNKHGAYFHKCTCSLDKNEYEF